MQPPSRFQMALRAGPFWAGLVHFTDWAFWRARLRARRLVLHASVAGWAVLRRYAPTLLQCNWAGSISC
jgi:hypothetical protein